jgi:hypothetical protein
MAIAVGALMEEVRIVSLKPLGSVAAKRGRLSIRTMRQSAFRM